MDQTNRNVKCYDTCNNGMKKNGDTNSKFLTNAHTFKNKNGSHKLNSQSLKAKINLLPDCDTFNKGLLLKESPDIYGERNFCSATGSLFMIKNAFMEKDGEQKNKKLLRDDKMHLDKEVHKNVNVNNKFDKNCRNLYKTTLRNRHLANNKLLTSSSFENVGCSEEVDYDKETNNTDPRFPRRLRVRDSYESLFRSHYGLLGKIDKLNQRKGTFQTSMPLENDYFMEENVGQTSLKSRSVESFQSGINSGSERIFHTNENIEGKKKKSKIVCVNTSQNSELLEHPQNDLHECDEEESKIVEDSTTRDKNHYKRQSKLRSLHVEGEETSSGEHKNWNMGTVSADDLWGRYKHNIEDPHEQKNVSDEEYSDIEEHACPGNDPPQHEDTKCVEIKDKRPTNSYPDDFPQSDEELLTPQTNIHEDGGEGDGTKIIVDAEDRLDDDNNDLQGPNESTSGDHDNAGDSEDESEPTFDIQNERIKNGAKKIILSQKDRLKILALLVCQFLMILSIIVVEHPYFDNNTSGYFMSPYDYSFVVDVLKPRATFLKCNWLHSITVLLVGSLCLHGTNGMKPFKSIQTMAITLLYMLVLVYFVSTSLSCTDAFMFVLASAYSIFMQFYFCWSVIKLY